MAPISPQAILLALIGGPQILQSMLSMYPPFSSGLAEKAYSKTPNLIPPPGDLVGQRQKGVISSGTFESLMEKAGYDSSMANNMFANARGYLAGLDYITAWRRGQLGESELNEVLTQQGLTERDIDVLKNVTIYYPTPQDLIRFAIRDVYTTQTVNQYGLNEDYPDLLDDTAAKAGLTPEIAHQYWAAHWELPSPTQVYDMFHRGIIEKEEVATYLKVADYMPYWRDKLIDLSYDPLGRIDIRRMYAMGVLTESEVTEGYKQLGYSPENAERLTRFTVLESKHGQDTTPSGTVITAYKAGVIDRTEAYTDLQKSNLSDDAINLMLETADIAIKNELRDLEVDALVGQYKLGRISKDELNTQLTKLGVPSRLLQITVAKAQAQDRAKVKYATKSDIDSWWRTGVIGSIDYISRLSNMGYTDTDCSLYLAELKVGELVGQDKKYPWAATMRDFHDGIVSRDSLTTELNTLTQDQNVIAELLSIGDTLKR